MWCMSKGFLLHMRTKFNVLEIWNAKHCFHVVGNRWKSVLCYYDWNVSWVTVLPWHSGVRYVGGHGRINMSIANTTERNVDLYAVAHCFHNFAMQDHSDNTCWPYNLTGIGSQLQVNRKVHKKNVCKQWTVELSSKARRQFSVLGFVIARTAH